MRVFHLIKSLGRGGAEMLLSEGLRYADRARFEYGYGYFLPWKDALVGPLREQGAEVTCFEARTGAEVLLAAPRVADHLREWKADVVHAHLPLACVVARTAGRMAGVPVVCTEHNLLERYNPWTRLANIATWRLQQQVVAVSEEVAGSIARNIGDDVPVRVVKNGVCVDEFRRDAASGAEMRVRLGIPHDAPVVGTVAVFRIQKRLDIWLEAAKRLTVAHPSIHFVMVGDGPLRGELEQLTRQHALTERVHFVGLQTDVRPYMSAMDIYMMSSTFEGLPIAMLEAMAMELPPVVTSAGGIPEVVDPGTSGVIVPKEDPAALVAAVDALIRDPARRRAIGAAARARVEAAFSMRRMNAELEALYESVLRRGAHAC